MVWNTKTKGLNLHDIYHSNRYIGFSKIKKTFTLKATILNEFPVTKILRGNIVQF